MTTTLTPDTDRIKPLFAALDAAYGTPDRDAETADYWLALARVLECAAYRVKSEHLAIMYAECAALNYKRAKNGRRK